MNASDDEFEQYLNELNDIVETVVLWITPNYVYLDPSINEVSWLSWIHEWPSSLVLSAFTHPITTFCFPSWLDPQPPFVPEFPAFLALLHHFGLNVSATRCILSSIRTPIHNKLALTSATTGYTKF